MTKPLYAVLGLTNDATADEIKNAYRSKSKDCHPNNAGNDGDEAKAKMWEAISTAYETLKDPEAKEKYDRTGEIKIDGASKINSSALQKVVNHFMKALTEGDADEHDIIAQARVAAREEVAAIEENVLSVKDQQEKFRKAQSRLKMKEANPDNPLDAALRTTIAEADRALEQLKRHEAVALRVLEILDRYDYESIIRQTITPSHNPSTTQWYYRGSTSTNF